MEPAQSISATPATASPPIDTLVQSFSHEYMQGISKADEREVNALLPLLNQEKLRGASSVRPVSDAVQETLRAVTPQRTPTPAWTTFARALVVVALICVLLYYLYAREESDAEERRGSVDADSGSADDDIALLANWNINEGDAEDDGVPTRVNAPHSASASASDPGQEIGREGVAASRVDDGVVDPLFQPL
tara:strand:+ start:480 stop:1052 length:573 start_codon:yes stop_codon:yes gene_type:complete